MYDMRSPLQAIQVTASYLAALNAGVEVSDAAARLTHNDRAARAHPLAHRLG
jgi:hypothetical protein